MVNLASGASAVTHGFLIGILHDLAQSTRTAEQFYISAHRWPPVVPPYVM